MIDHFTLTVRNMKKMRAFYEKALAPLGYVVTKEFSGWVAFGTRVGKKTQSHLWLKPDKRKLPPLHIAFIAPNHKAVDAFHKAALAAGAKDNGKPGPREYYHPEYYGAFVFDPEGHPIEALHIKSRHTTKRR